MMRQERAAAAASDPYRYVEKRKPIPDAQVLYWTLLTLILLEFRIYGCLFIFEQETGLVYGSKNGAKISEGSSRP